MVDQTLTQFLKKLGIEPETAKVYLSLIGKSAQTAHQVAKNTQIPKTTVYRRLDELKNLGLIEEKIDEYKKEYLASSVQSLQLLVNKKEIEAKELASQLPIISHVLSTSANVDPETKILFYRGRDGIQQMNWNVLRAKSEIVGYSYRVWEEIVGKDFIEKFLEDYSLLCLSGRDLISQAYIESRKNVTEGPLWKNWQTRYLDPKIVDINHQMDIYNDVVAIYNWHDGEVFGVEIYNQKVATMQKQIFEVLWKLGKDKSV
ncbi:hypothetical protein HY310_03780 [Candidatus Microgenomates bacterium]|nr:hypothetical protein [Candidatus Microgenomates bacterium]